jgi:hypothetical protein
MVDLTLDDLPPPPRKANGNAAKPSDQKNRKALSAQVLPEAQWIEKEFAPAATQVPTPVSKENAAMHRPEAKFALASSAPSVRVGAMAPRSSVVSLTPPTEKVEKVIIPPSPMPVDNRLREGPTVKFASPLKPDASFYNGNNFRDEGVPRSRKNSSGQEPIRKKGQLGHGSLPTGKQRRRNMVPEFEIEEDPMDRIVEVGIYMHRLVDE